MNTTKEREIQRRRIFPTCLSEINIQETASHDWKDKNHQCHDMSQDYVHRGRIRKRFPPRRRLRSQIQLKRWKTERSNFRTCLKTGIDWDSKKALTPTFSISFWGLRLTSIPELLMQHSRSECREMDLLIISNVGTRYISKKKCTNKKNVL